MLGRLAIAFVTTLELCPCPDSGVFQPICHPNSPDMPDDGTLKVSWVTPRVPYGAPSIEIAGMNFGSSPADLQISLQPMTVGTGPSVTSIAIQTNLGQTVVVASLSWPPQASAVAVGPAAVRVSRNDGSAPQSLTTQVVVPAFKQLPQPADLKNPVTWQYLGKASTANVLLVLDNLQNLQGIAYKSDGTFPAALTAIASGAKLTAATPSTLSPTPVGSDVLSVSQTGNMYPCLLMASNVYDCSNPNPFGPNPWKIGQAVASGASDRGRELFAVVGDKQLFRCYYDRTAIKQADTCDPIAGFAGDAQALWAGPLGAGGRADIVVLDKAGKISLFRDSGSGSFSDLTDTMLAGARTKASWRGLAAVDVDGLNGTDLVALDPSGVTTWLNQGDGTFKPFDSKLSQVGATQLGPLVLGDIDGDAKSDLLLLTASGIQVALNLFDGGQGNGRFSAPAPVLEANSLTPLTVVSPSVLSLDDGQPLGVRRRLLISSGSSCEAWDNQTKP